MARILVLEGGIARVGKETWRRRRVSTEMLHLSRLHVAARDDVEGAGAAWWDDARGDRSFARPAFLVPGVDSLAHEHAAQLAIALERAFDWMIHLSVCANPNPPVGIRLAKSE